MPNIPAPRRRFALCLAAVLVASAGSAAGSEALDTDTTDKMDSETYLLQKGHSQIEVMANLDKVPATGALIVVTWPKVKDGLGFPARAFAVLR